MRDAVQALRTEAGQELPLRRAVHDGGEPEWLPVGQARGGSLVSRAMTAARDRRLLDALIGIELGSASSS
jgi:hypothetical protein